MRKLPSLLLTFPLLFAIGWSLQVMAIVMRYDYIVEAHLRTAAVQVASWLAMVVPAFLVLDRILRRSRSKAVEAASIALLCVACALAGQLLYGNLAWMNRWYHRGDRDYFLLDSRMATAMRLATRRLESPLLLSACALLIGRFLLADREERERALREKRLETRLSIARLQLLRSQLNPHFLFNALNSVMALVRRDPIAAEAMLARLSRFYEITAETEGRTWIPLRDEVAFAREYLDIEQIRFGTRLAVTIETTAIDARVPALLLQPLVENAVRHGAAKTTGAVWIRLRIANDGEHVRIEIANRGAFQSNGDGVGLANTRRRLREAFGDASALEIACLDDETRVIVTVPEAA
jgi:two-component system, LytTR family, sensor kinase